MPAFVNLGIASTLVWNDQEKRTYVSFPGANDAFPVLEKPEVLLTAAGKTPRETSA
jgi:hypothetical protein